VILLDSNIVIYLRDPATGPRISEQFRDQRLGTCNVIIAEVLGFGELTVEDSEAFEKFFAAMKNYPFDGVVTRKTIEIRRAINMQLPDAIIAASAIKNNLTLWTHNLDDFRNVPGLKVFDPL
jgi:predicted nucleic acid-binding protein